MRTPRCNSGLAFNSRFKACEEKGTGPLDERFANPPPVPVAEFVRIRVWHARILTNSATGTGEELGKWTSSVAYRHIFRSIGQPQSPPPRWHACPTQGAVVFYRNIRIPDNSAVFRIQKTRQFREICIGTIHALGAAVNAWIKVAGT